MLFRSVRRLSWQAQMDYVEDAGRTVVQNRDLSGEFGIEFNSGDSFNVSHERNYEWLPRNFTIAPRVIVPRGGYNYTTTTASYTVGQQRKVSGRVSASVGSFYGEGTKREASYSGYVGLSSHLAFEPSASLAWVDLPYGDFRARVISVRTIVTPTARLMFSGLTQYNAALHSVSSSARMRWEYRSGSEFFVVYSDGRDTLGRGFPDMVNRSFAVKLTRLLRY